MDSRDGNIYEFADFRLIPGEGLLLRNGEQVSLAPKAFSTLVLLVQRHGHLVEKTELIDRIWENAFVEEAAVSRCVWGIRNALGEDPKNKKFIQTVSKRGYRFVSEVTEFRRETKNGNGTLARGNQETLRTVPERSYQPATGSDMGSGTVVPFRISRERLAIAPAANSEPDVIATAETQNSLSLSIRRHKPIVAFALAALLVSAIGLSYYVFYGLRLDSSPGNIRSIAVLPFKPLNADSRDEALEMGMAETLITRLSNLNQVVVRPMSAVRKYTDPQQDSIKAGHDLQTEVVLDGSIQKAGDRVRITVRLVNTLNGMALWSEQFDENFTDIFKLQDSIAERITNALAVRLSRQEREQLTKHHTDSPEAYELYLQGEYLWLNRRKDNLAEQTLSFYQRALEKDPNFALAYIGIAEYYIRESSQRIPGSEAESKARSNIMKALEIDDTLAEAHNALAELKYQYEYDWVGAEKDFKKAIELNPNVAAIRLGYGWFLMSATRFDEAAVEMEKAREFDPSSLTAKVARGRLLYFSRQYDRALQHFQSIIAVEPNSPSAYVSITQIYLQKQMYAEFFEAFIIHQGLIGTPPEKIEEFQRVFTVSGVPGLTRHLLNVTETKAKTAYVSPTVFALLNTHLGQKDEALAWLEKAFDERHPFIVQLGIDPEFDSLRDDPRFQDLLRRAGLPQ